MHYWGFNKMKEFIVAAICLSASTIYAQQFPTASIKQFATTNQQTNSWKRDRWQPEKRWNAIDPRTGLKKGGFIQKDTWEPDNRWNVYDHSGNYSGMIKRDRFESDRWNYTPSDGGIGSYDDGIGGYNDGIGGLPTTD
jgi:hypothetical protein